MILNFCKTIKKLRKINNFTQQELAVRLGVTKASVSAYENGSRMPSYEILMKMAGLFRVNSDNLLTGNSLQTVDVNGLTSRQLASIRETIAAYQTLNRLTAFLTPAELKSLNLEDCFADPLGQADTTKAY